MTLATLIATPADFGSEAGFLARMLDEYNEVPEFDSAAEIEEIFLEAARADLSLALPRYGRAPLSSTVYNDSIGRTADEAAWRYLLSRRQLALVYEWADEGEGSLNRTKWRQYEREYTVALAGVPALFNGSGGAGASRTITVGL